ncbi:MAG: hypothetical protein C0631_06230 [Sedimenticola sp.]|nr:MAG: hypothetical protein C0631_06230 [Sedimenticola sp.]
MLDQNDVSVSTAIDEDYFASAELTQKMNLLLHLTENGDRIALIKGLVNSGKSAFLQQFIRMSPGNWLLCRIDANPLLQPDQLFDKLGKCFDVDIKADEIDYLLQRFEYLQLTGQMPVIVVDDAHQLPVASVIALFRLFERRVQNTALVKLLLFASPEMDAYLRTPQMQAMNLQLLQIMEMPVLTKEQTEEFAGFIFSREGVKHRIKLSVAEIDRLYRESAGKIGEVEAAVGRILKGKSKSVKPAEKPQRAKVALWSDIPLGAVIGGGLVALLLILALLFQDDINTLFTGEPVAEPMSEEPSMANEPELPIPVTADEEPVGNSGLASQDQPLREIGSAPPVMALSLPEIGKEERPESGTADTEELVTEPISTPEPVQEELQEEIAAAIVPANATPMETEQIIREVPPPQQPVVLSESLKNRQSDQGAVDARPKSPVSEAKKPLVKSEKTSKGGISPGEKYLLDQKATAYTLQLIGVYEAKAAEAFIKRYGLENQAKYFRTTLNGRDWYSVVYGVYPNRDAAAVAKATLPKSLTNRDIWPRPLASVQSAIRQRK